MIAAALSFYFGTAFFCTAIKEQIEQNFLALNSSSCIDKRVIIDCQINDSNHVFSTKNIGDLSKAFVKKL